MIKKIIGIMMTISVLLSGLSVMGYAVENNGKITIFIDGINSEDIVNVNTGEVVYPPQGKDITRVVFKNIPTVTKALITGKHDIIVDPLADDLKSLFAPVVVDENGNPAPDTYFNYQWPSKEEIKEYMNSDDPDKQLKYAFDWRLDMITVASQLHDFIEYVIDTAKVDTVSLIGCSMGSCAMLSYLKLYDYQYVDSAIVYVGGVNGTNTCGEPFSGNIGFNSDSIVRYVDCVMGENIGGIIVSALLQNLDSIGLMDKIAEFSEDLTNELNDAVYEKLFSVTFGCVPGMWSLVPYDLYPVAKELNGSALSPEMLERVDWYHYEVQAKSAEIMRGCLERGIKTAIISKYGYPGIPCVDSADNMTDMMIDTVYSSFGATIADVTEEYDESYVQVNDNGHNCISPDRLIDSSTCELCDYTWFIKNSKHSDDYAAIKPLFDYIIDSENQVNVWDGNYPQYLILDDGVIKPLTCENNYSAYNKEIGSDNIFIIFINTMKRFIKYFENVFSVLFHK